MGLKQVVNAGAIQDRRLLVLVNSPCGCLGGGGTVQVRLPDPSYLLSANGAASRQPGATPQGLGRDC
jgi:hypothetical protein